MTPLDDTGHVLQSSRHRTLIEPANHWQAFNLVELWRYRDLLWLLLWRDISARFRQSVIGYGWAILRPALTAAIFTLVFGVFVKVETAVPYPIFAFAGLMPWLYFSTSLSGVTQSVVGGSALLTKVYFPRLVLPLAKVGVGLVEFMLQFLVLVGLMVWYRFVPGYSILAIPMFVLITIVTALAFGIWLTALNVRYRDIGMAVPFLVQIWMYLCPIAYPISLVPERFQALYSLNPMVGVIEGFRWSLLNSSSPDWSMIGISFLSTFVVLVGGLFYFRRVESTFADVI
ncbi:ABC transporter permease [Roseiconus lacunae]|uniref:Transport permease protein n=1 Tax=Roseiconus lacunae TaxID=2605694 RepID=A0ABT7PQ89_9BACT|nr:ABC transporter permease [Roseiconus lacunae]MDM4018454.1 ABC transporter permease [Roseiconus lacunae]